MRPIFGPPNCPITRQCAILFDLEMKHHALRQRVPTGIRIADDEADSKREKLASQIEAQKSKIETMRNDLKRNV